MAKPVLGTKRICGACGARFYDLAKDPIVCPKCGTVYDVAVVVPKAKPAPVKAAVKPVAPVETDEDEADEALVPLEDADAEEEDTGRADPDIEEDIPDIEEEEIDDDDDDGFLPDEEDEGDDVADLIEGDIEGEEET